MSDREAMLADPALSHLSFDISWDEVAKYAVSSPEAIARVAALLNKYPDRFLFGTDTVAPAGPAPYFAVFEMWAPVFEQLTPETSRKVRLGGTSGCSRGAPPGPCLRQPMPEAI
jgi:hypothetical protein